MTTTQQSAIERHGRQLLAIFPDATETDPVKLCKKLRRIEVKANRLAIAYCNGDIDGDKWEAKSDDLLCDVVALLCPGTADLCAALFMNGDARGYTIKIDDEYMRAHNLELHKDWGGYGIIAPEIDENGN